MKAAIASTSIGPIGIGWNEQGLVRVLLPELEDDVDGTRVRHKLVREGFAVAEVPDEIGARWIERIVAHLAGDEVAFDDLPLDDRALSPFARAVSAATRAIPRGSTATYADIAARITNPSARAVGVALGKNPMPIVIPCHRVVGVDAAGGFSAPGGASTKAQLLVIEGAALGDVEHRAARRHLQKVDRELAPWVKKIPCTLPIRARGALFRTIVRAIAGQQLSTKAAATIFARLERAIFGVATASDDWVAPAPTAWSADAPARLLALSMETLRGVGLSNAKALSVLDLARRVTSGALVLDRLVRAPDEQVIESLREVRGIGRWTAEMLLIFELGRPDVLPVDDLGIRKGAQKVYRLRSLPSPDAVTKRCEAWRPWRSIGSFYLWRSLDTPLTTNATK